MLHYWKYKFLSLLVALLPSWMLYFFVDFFSWLLFHCKPVKRNNVIQNILVVLQAKFPFDEKKKMGEKYISNIAKNIFNSFGYYLIEFFRFDSYDKKWVKDKVTIKGLGYIDSALSKGNGAILVTAHIGNWELGAAVMSLVGYSISGVYFSHEDEKLNEMYVNQRRRKGIDFIPLLKAQELGLKRLKQNRLLALPLDFNLAEKGIPVKLFGHRILLPRGPYIFAARTKAPILLAVFARKGKDAFDLIFKPIIAQDDYTNLISKDVIMQRVAHILQETITEYIDQWCIFKQFFPA
ncbi:lysophospholipid acyltransferase family protein [Chlamydiota bacterium]